MISKKDRISSFRSQYKLKINNSLMIYLNRVHESKSQGIEIILMFSDPSGEHMISISATSNYVDLEVVFPFTMVNATIHS